MTQELLYTSAPRGLKPGVKGFCTVASTAGMPAPLVERLESLSGYRHLYPPHDQQARLNPVQYSHLIVKLGGQTLHVLSRVCDAGLDYSQRSNKLAHHVALTEAELGPAGPAWLLGSPGFMETSFTGEPRILPAGRQPPPGASPPRVCQAWEAASGDAGWAGVLAETAAAPALKVVNVIYPPGAHILPLVEEAMALLPAARRWAVTFSTYYTKLPPGIDCHWRFLVEGEAEAKTARRTPQIPLIDLCVNLGPAEGGPLVSAARTGRVPEPIAAAHEPTAAEPARVGRATFGRDFRNAESMTTREPISPVAAPAVEVRRHAAGPQSPPQLWPTINPAFDPSVRKGKARRIVIAAAQAFGVVLLTAGAFALGELRGQRAAFERGQQLNEALAAVKAVAQFESPTIKSLAAAEGELNEKIAPRFVEWKELEKLRAQIVDARTEVTGGLNKRFAAELKKLDKSYQDFETGNFPTGQSPVEAATTLKDQIAALSMKTEGVEHSQVQKLEGLATNVDDLQKQLAAKSKVKPPSDPPPAQVASASTSAGSPVKISNPGSPEAGPPREPASDTQQPAAGDAEGCWMRISKAWGEHDDHYLAIKRPTGDLSRPETLALPFCDEVQLDLDCRRALRWDRELVAVRLKPEQMGKQRKWLVQREHKTLGTTIIGEFSSDGSSLGFMWRDIANKPFNHLCDCALKVKMGSDDRDFKLRAPRRFEPLTLAVTIEQKAKSGRPIECMDDGRHKDQELEDRPWPEGCRFQMAYKCSLSEFRLEGSKERARVTTGLALPPSDIAPIVVTFARDQRFKIRFEPKFERRGGQVFYIDFGKTILLPQRTEGETDWEPVDKSLLADVRQAMTLADRASVLGLTPPKGNLLDEKEVRAQQAFTKTLERAAGGGRFTKSFVSIINELRSPPTPGNKAERNELRDQLEQTNRFWHSFAEQTHKDAVLLEVTITFESEPDLL